MNNVRSGLILIVSGVVLNLLGRAVILVTGHHTGLVMAALMAVWMFASVVIVLFGCFRLIVGLVTK